MLEKSYNTGTLGKLFFGGIENSFFLTVYTLYIVRNIDIQYSVNICTLNNSYSYTLYYDSIYNRVRTPRIAL